MSSLCFYSIHSPRPLPIKSLTSVLKASKISGHFLLKHSHNPLVSSCPPNCRLVPGRLEKLWARQNRTLSFNRGHHTIGYINTAKVPEEKSIECYRDFISRSFKERFITFWRQFDIHSRDGGQGGWVTSSRISCGSLYLRHQSTLSRFVSLQLLILYHHQVTWNAGESPLKPPIFCEMCAELHTV